MAKRESNSLPPDLPALPAGWEWKALLDYVARDRGISYGIVQPGDEDPEGVPVLRVDNVHNSRIDLRNVMRVSPQVESKYSRTRLVGGELLITLVGAYFGKVAIAPKSVAGFNTARAVGVIPVESDARFILLALQSPVCQYYMQTWATTTAQPTLNLADVGRIPIPSPSRSIRDGIADVLGGLDEKIELNRRMNETLEAMARALFQSWFVDFDPVRAKLDGRKLVGLDDATAALFPDHFEDSPLGSMPKGWKATTLGSCIGFRSGYSFKSDDWQESGIPVVKIGSVKPGVIDLSQVSYVSQEVADNAARFRLSVGDLLIGMTGYVGEVGLVPPTDNLPLLNQRVGKFVLPKSGTETLGYWYCTTRQQEFRAFVESRSHGTAQANVSGEAIMEFPIPSPPSDILDAFNRACRPLLDRILANHGELRTLSATRDALLPRLLSGELSPQLNP